jgi:hypothetical protein
MTSQESAEAELSKQVATLIDQIESIESDESLETEEQIQQLLVLSGDVKRLAEIAIPAEQQLAKVLLSSYVNATPWFEADYGPDGFYYEHEDCSEVLFNLGQNWPKDLIPETYDSEKGNFCFCAGLSMNPSLTVEKLEHLMDSAKNYGYGMDEDAVLFVAHLLNPNSTPEFVLKRIERLSGDEVDWLLGLITGDHMAFGYSSEKTQELVMEATYSVDALKAIRHCVESNKTGTFNQICFTDEGARFVSPIRVLEAIDVRLASKNPRFHHFENN